MPSTASHTPPSTSGRIAGPWPQRAVTSDHVPVFGVSAYVSVPSLPAYVKTKLVPSCATVVLKSWTRLSGRIVSGRFGNGSLPGPVLVPLPWPGNIAIPRSGRGSKVSGGNCSVKTARLSKNSTRSSLFRPLAMSSPTKLAPSLTIAICSGVRRRVHRYHSSHTTVVSGTFTARPCASRNFAVIDTIGVLALGAYDQLLPYTHRLTASNGCAIFTGWGGVIR